MKAYERTHDNENVSIVISSDASMTELIAGRDFLQAEIDGRTPTLEEPDAVTVQSGPVQVVKTEPGWSEWFEWSGGENPVGDCRVECEVLGCVKHPPVPASARCWFICDAPFLITRYRVLLSSIPDGWSLMGGILVEDLPNAEIAGDRPAD